MLQFSTIGFDASLLDVLPTLICGAELVAPSEDQRRDPQQLLTLIRQQEVSHAFLPPALLSILPLDQPLGLSHLITGGDVCEPAVIAQLAGQCQLHNIYGPTEATVLATTRVFQAGDNPRNLGRPIANTQVLILDQDLQPVLEQQPGELYIDGLGVGLGYLNNPALSDECFLQLTLADGISRRLYRTGDIGKWSADGIELCGRRDNQVKIRGFRVEPEEIEHCLRNSGLFRQLAVVIDDQRRILVFAAQPQSTPDDVALREYAELHLPDYMRPAFYQLLAQMPYTANGKVDRQALLKLPRGYYRPNNVCPRATPPKHVCGPCGASCWACPKRKSLPTTVFQSGRPFHPAVALVAGGARTVRLRYPDQPLYRDADRATPRAAGQPASTDQQRSRSPGRTRCPS